MSKTRNYFILLTALPFFFAAAAFTQDTAPGPPEPPAITDIAADKLTVLQESLDLTAEQSASISVLFINSLTKQREIMEQMREINESVKTGIDTILTEEQKEILKDNPRLRGAVSLAPPQGPRGPRGGPEGIRGRRGMRDRGREGFRKIAAALDVTAEQRAEIRRLVGEDKTDMRKALDQVLTEDQKAKLEDIREKRPNPPMAGPRGSQGPEGQRGMRGPRGGIKRLAEDLELTAEQRTEIRRLITEDKVRVPEALEQVLTDEQKVKLEELRAERPGREKRREGRGKGPWAEPPLEF